MNQMEELPYIQGMPIPENFPIDLYKQVFRRVLSKTQQYAEKARKEADEASNTHTTAKLEAMKPTLTPTEKTEAEKKEQQTLHFFEEKSAKTNKIDERYKHFIGGWSGTFWRFYSCMEHSNIYTESFRRSGALSQGYEAYLQDKALFGFFSCGFSALECLCYSLYVIGAMIQPEKFPLTEKKELKKVKLKVFADIFENEFHSKTLQDIIKTEEYQQWSKIRNVLTHASGTAGRSGTVRITVNLSPQVVNLSPQTESSDAITYTLWVKDLPINDFTTSSRLPWLEDTLNTLIHEVNGITKNHLS